MEAVIHLCAVGLGPDSLRILVVDPDKSNGNFTRLKLLVDKYTKCAAIFGHLGKGKRLFGTTLDLLDAEGEERGIKIWSPVKPNQTLGDLFEFNTLPRTPPNTADGGVRAVTSQDVVDLFFTAAERRQRLMEGFRGHPSIGAAALALLSRNEQKMPWSEVAKKIRLDLAQPAGSRVFLVGSVFGGTGASALHPLARFLRGLPNVNKDRLKIGVAALVPYFQFGQAAVAESEDGEAGALVDDKLAAKAEWFQLATRSAVEYYQHLQTNNDWPFDEVYWAGDSGKMRVRYDEGGSGQKNPAHFVDLLAGLAALDFFSSSASEPAAPGTCFYAGPRQDVVPPTLDKNLLDWADLPLMRKNRAEVKAALLKFVLVGAVHVGFNTELIDMEVLDQRDRCVPWYKDRVRNRGLSLRRETETSKLALLRDFFRVCHFPWWSQMLSLEGSTDVRLFSKAAFQSVSESVVEVPLDRLGNLLWDDGTATLKPNPMDAFFTDMVKVGGGNAQESAAELYLALLDDAAARFVVREYHRA